MESQRFELVPEAAPTVTVHVDDGRETSQADEDLIEIGLTMPEGSAAVALSLEEVVRLRDALTLVIERPLD